MSGDDDTEITIGQMARTTGLSRDTLRYYEREGLIPGVPRNGSGHRRFGPDHLKWIGLLERLSTSGMSIARMREYVTLALDGDETVEARRRLLAEHEADIRARIAELESCLEIVGAKIALYEGRLDDPARVWRLVAEARAEDADVTPGGLRGPA
jgi:DNA-binding transcriptional MerR regulator